MDILEMIEFLHPTKRWEDEERGCWDVNVLREEFRKRLYKNPPRSDFVSDGSNLHARLVEITSNWPYHGLPWNHADWQLISDIFKVTERLSADDIEDGKTPLSVGVRIAESFTDEKLHDAVMFAIVKLREAQSGRVIYGELRKACGWPEGVTL